MEDQINASKILHSSAIYIQSMKITRSLCEKLLMIKSVKKKITPSITVQISVVQTHMDDLKCDPALNTCFSFPYIGMCGK